MVDDDVQGEGGTTVDAGPGAGVATSDPVALVVISEKATTDRIVALTDSDLWSGTPGKGTPEELQAAAHSIRGGASPEPLLGDASTRIPLAKIKDVKANRHGTEMVIRYRGWIGNVKSATVDFASASVRDDVLEAMELQLGSACVKFEVQYGLVRASLLPLAWIAGTALFTWMAFHAARVKAQGGHVSAHGKAQALVWIAELLGRGGVLIVGTLVTACLVLWLVGRVRQPPLMVTLKRTSK